VWLSPSEPEKPKKSLNQYGPLSHSLGGWNAPGQPFRSKKRESKGAGGLIAIHIITRMRLAARFQLNPAPHKTVYAGLSSAVLSLCIAACGADAPVSSASGGGTSVGGSASTSGGAGGIGVGGANTSGASASGGTPAAGGGGGTTATGGSNNAGSGGSGGSGVSPGGASAAGGGGLSSGGNQGTGGAAPSTCTPKGQAHNPLVSQIFTADPNAIVYGDRVYVYTSHDEDGQVGYKMVDYHVFSSSDLANWQDHGVIIHAKDLPWAGNLYAPGACTKNGKYYIYIPNSGSAIGVGVSDDPGGPFKDPLGKGLLTPSFPNANVPWLFDPACFIDDDGQAYLYFGGGSSGQNARVVRLNDNMTSIKDTSATKIDTTAFFEASYMHKHGDKYYFSYSSDFSSGHGAKLEYLMSDNPMTGFTYKGVLLANGSINNGNNNHGSIIEFMGKSYLFYHSRKLQQELGVNKVDNRSIVVQELKYKADGTIEPLTMSTSDFTVAQTKCLDGFAEVQAETLAQEKGIEVEGKAGETVNIAQISSGDWIGYSQVDFKNGASKLVLRVSGSGGSIDVSVDGCLKGQPGTSIGKCAMTNAAGGSTYAPVECTISGPAGPHDLCLTFSGTPNFRIDSWHLE